MDSFLDISGDLQLCLRAGVPVCQGLLYVSIFHILKSIKIIKTYSNIEGSLSEFTHFLYFQVRKKESIKKSVTAQKYHSIDVKAKEGDRDDESGSSEDDKACKTEPNVCIK